jgi:hypothetical protein
MASTIYDRFSDSHIAVPGIFKILNAKHHSQIKATKPITMKAMVGRQKAQLKLK